MRTSILLLVALSACVDPSVGRDRDGDGFFTSELDGDDCDDTNANVNPDASEACGNGIDDDCDGIVDDAGVGERSWFVDGDEDGFAGPVQFTGCSAPAGAFSDLSRGEDCDDTRSDINPGAAEVWYDGVDQNCNADNDNDADGDGFVAVSQGGDDCADDDAVVNPNAVEVCNNGVDDNCDGEPNQCEYAGEVDLEAVASTVFATESSGQWLDDFNGDGVMDALLAVDERSNTRNRLELYLGPLQPQEEHPDAIVFGPEGRDWSWNENQALIGGDFNSDGYSDIVVSGSYPEEEGSSIRIFYGPFASEDLDGDDADVVVELVSAAPQRLSIGTKSMSILRTSGVGQTDMLLWAGRPAGQAPQLRVLAPTPLQTVISMAETSSIDSPGIEWLPELLVVGVLTPVVLQGTGSGETATPRALSALTVELVSGSFQADMEGWNSAFDTPAYGLMTKQADFDLDNDGSLDLLLGGYTLTSLTGEPDSDFSITPKVVSGTSGRLPISITTPPVAHVADHLGLFRTLAVCNLTNSQMPEHLESIEFYAPGQGTSPAFQTLRWSTLDDSTTTVGEWEFQVSNGYVWNAHCAKDGEHLFASLWSDSTFLIPPIRW